MTSTLLPFAGSGRLFGDHAGLDEVFFSLAENPIFPPGLQPGVILAGFTEGAWESPADPRDLYLVQHGASSSSSPCALAWTPGGTAVSFPRANLLALRRAPASSAAALVQTATLSTQFPVCP